MTATAPPPELALFLQSWLNLWPAPARDLWHDLAQGRLSSVVYHTKEGRRFAGGSWPAWCYFPNGLVEHWMQHRGDLKQPFFRDLAERYDGYLQGDQISFAPMLAALLCRWRLGKGVYRIHPRMLDALRDTELTPEIPIATLYHLPEWAVLVETPGFAFQGKPIAGFAAYLNSNHPQSEDPALVLHLFKPGPYEPGSFPAYTRSFRLDHETLGECYQASLAAMAAANVQADWQELLPFLSLLLYLCSTNREIHDTQGREFQPVEPKVQVSKKKGMRVFAAEKISTWQVAWRIGAVLEAAERREGGELRDRLPSAPTGVPRKPHIRRAHWHLFWAGKGRTEPRVHWLPPIPVNVAAEQEPTVVVHPVATE
jgi:hypothetical protein